MSNRISMLDRTASVPCGLPPTGHAETGAACRTVLLVEDDEQVLKLVSRTLTSLGHTVVEAQNGETALNAIHANPAIDCLFSDVVMPNGMNGVQLAQQARVMRPDLRAVLTSVRPRDEVRAMGELPCDVTFVAKPYSLTDIASLLRWGTKKLGRPAAVGRRWFTDPKGLPFIVAPNAQPTGSEGSVFSDRDCHWVGLDRNQ
jgi:CheY-like chemotaxis protein